MENETRSEIWYATQFNWMLSSLLFANEQNKDEMTQHSCYGQRVTNPCITPILKSHVSCNTTDKPFFTLTNIHFSLHMKWDAPLWAVKNIAAPSGSTVNKESESDEPNECLDQTENLPFDRLKSDL